MWWIQDYPKQVKELTERLCHMEVPYWDPTPVSKHRAARIKRAIAKRRKKSEIQL